MYCVNYSIIKAKWEEYKRQDRTSLVHIDSFAYVDNFIHKNREIVEKFVKMAPKGVIMGKIFKLK